MPTTPAVSVVMPVYNARRYLREALDSILHQTWREFELIAIDDGCTDGSGEILDEYAAADDRITIIRRPNTGIVGALNDGLAAARGEFVARMDADDVSLPQRFARQLEHFRRHPNCVLVGSRVMLTDPAGRPIRTWATETTHAEIDAAHLTRGWPVVHPSVMMRRSSVEQVGRYREQYRTLEDLDLFLRLAEVGELNNLPEVLLNYRQHFASICHTETAQQAKIRDAILGETAARRGTPTPPGPPAPPKKSRAEAHRLWAWWALNEGHVPTARRHAASVVARAPWSPESWRLMYCALRGR